MNATQETSQRRIHSGRERRPALFTLLFWLQDGMRERDTLLRIYDPRAGAKMATRFPAEAGLRYVRSAYEAATGAHALLILTDWDEFRSLDWQQLRRLMRTPVVVDGRNLVDPAEMREQGFEYDSFRRTGTQGSPPPEGPRRRAPVFDSQPPRVHIGSIRALAVGGH